VLAVDSPTSCVAAPGCIPDAIVRSKPAPDSSSQTFPRVLIHYDEGPDRPPFLRALEDEFVRPDVISALSPTANSSTATPFGRTPKPASPSSISSRAGTTPIAAKEKDKKLLFTGVNMSA